MELRIFTTIKRSFLILVQQMGFSICVMLLNALLFRILEELQKDYGSVAYSYSPLKFSAAVEKFCREKPEQVLREMQCAGKDVRVFNSTLIGPFQYPQHKNYFTDVTDETYKKQIENSVLFHLFNKLSANKILSVHSKSLYVRAARDFCPISHASCSETF
jgi:Alpha 1,4-glycosyltransferase conserved region